MTDELASRPELQLHPVLIEEDECQVWFMHMDKRINAEFERLADDLVRKGRRGDHGVLLHTGTRQGLHSPLGAQECVDPAVFQGERRLWAQKAV